jgi:GA4 desaturase
MGSIEETPEVPTQATFTCIDPDKSVDPWDCEGYFAIPRPKTLDRPILPLYNLRETSNIFTLSSQITIANNGFTAVKHASRLHSAPYTEASFRAKENLEDIYAPEVQNLLKREVCCSKVFIISSALRLLKGGPPLKTAAQKAADPDLAKREPDRCGIKLNPNDFDLEKPMIAGEKAAAHPARAVHVDYSPKGARTMLRNYRTDITEEAKDIVEAEDRRGPGEGRRYAYYSVWRPIKEVRRDPLAICDPRSLVPERDLVEHTYKVCSYSLLSRCN